MPDQPSARRRFQFRLRTLMIVVMVGSALYVSGCANGDNKSSETRFTPADSTTTASAESAGVPAAHSEMLTRKGEVEVWYWKNREAIEENGANVAFAVLDAITAGDLNDAQSDAEKSRQKKAEAEAIAELGKQKAKLLENLAQNPKRIPAPPIYPVHSQHQHLEEIRRSNGLSK